jgi:hypothetical protein
MMEVTHGKSKTEHAFILQFPKSLSVQKARFPSQIWIGKRKKIEQKEVLARGGIKKKKAGQNDGATGLLRFDAGCARNGDKSTRSACIKAE